MNATNSHGTGRRMRLRALVAVLAVTGALDVAGGGPAQAAGPVLCGGRLATVVGTEGRDVLRGTPGNDVIAALGATTWCSGWAATTPFAVAAGAMS